MDVSELCDLERFAASLEPPESPEESHSLTQPGHLYTVLCKAARLYLGSTTASTITDFLGFDPDAFSSAGLTGTNTSASTLEEPGHEEGWLGEWFYGNQLVMGAMDQNAFF
jgi:hypothetical protein